MKVEKKIIYEITPETTDELKKILKIKNMDEYDFVHENYKLIDSIQESQFEFLINDICNTLLEVNWIGECSEIYYDFNPNGYKNEMYFPIDFNLTDIKKKVEKIENSKAQEIIKEFIEKIEGLNNIYGLSIKNIEFSYNPENNKVYIHDLILSDQDYLRIYFLKRKSIEEDYNFSNINDFINNVAVDKLLEIVEIDIEEMETIIKEYIKDMYNEFISFISSIFNADVEDYFEMLVDNDFSFELTEEEFEELKNLKKGAIMDCTRYLKAYQLFQRLQEKNLAEVLMDYNYDIEKMADDARELHRYCYDNDMPEEEWEEVNELFYEAENYSDEIEEISKLYYNGNLQNFYKNFINFLIEECL